MVFAAWLLLLGFGLLANYVFEFVIATGLVTGASASITKSVSGLYLVASGLGITLTAFIDQVSLVANSIRSNLGNGNGEGNQRETLSG